MSNIYYVYQLRLENSDKPFYIGKGKGNRITNHFTDSSRKLNNIKNKIISKAEKQGIKILSEFLCTGLSEESALSLEMKLIKLLGRRDINTGILANMTDGGEGKSGAIASLETRKKRSESLKICGRDWTPSEETKAKISKTLKGRPITQEILAKRIGKKHSESHSTNISNALKMYLENNSRPTGICQYCNGEFQTASLARWHGDNCKNKPISTNH